MHGEKGDRKQKKIRPRSPFLPPPLDFSRQVWYILLNYYLINSSMTQ